MVNSPIVPGSGALLVKIPLVSKWVVTSELPTGPRSGPVKSKDKGWHIENDGSPPMPGSRIPSVLADCVTVS